uniref:NADH-ubiquinone oxidoreductase chain 6 n=1 Tax=Nemichthys scolopaceus TaxID=118170 RepID=D1YTU2_9TELE|nr:NADH dehydrogenase subunit 6 [Nemichthys scolopaceus]BAI53326.1 NADH dehydrogenase subunit 6 [Nemichthys scolopaceus]
MSYITFLLLLVLVVGFLGVASNPAPYFAALGLVLAAVGGCGVLVGCGGSFISLILLLIYLGGMLVVFAYSAALAAEPYPESWGDWSVLGYLFGYVLLCLAGVGTFYGGWFGSYCGVVDECRDMSMVRGDLSGVSLIYCWGGGMLFVCGWALLITLLVVLELTRGLSRGALRAI